MSTPPVTSDLLRRFCKAINVPVRDDARWEDTDARLWEMAWWLMATPRADEGSVLQLALRIGFCEAAEMAREDQHMFAADGEHRAADACEGLYLRLLLRAGIDPKRWEAAR